MAARKYTDEERAEAKLKDTARRKARAKARRLADPELTRQKDKERYAKHREDYKSRAAAWAAENKDRRSQYNKHWSTANAAQRKSTKSKWNKENRARCREVERAYRANNLEHVQKVYRDWCKNNPDKIAAWKAKNSEKLKAQSIIATEKRREKFKASFEEYERLYSGQATYPRRVAVAYKWDVCGRLCYICGLDLPFDDIAIDHVHPIVHGGSNDIKNLMPTHKKCNSQKHCRLDFPIARPLLVLNVAHIQAVPRNIRKLTYHEYTLEAMTAVRRKKAA